MLQFLDIRRHQLPLEEEGKTSVLSRQRNPAAKWTHTLLAFGVGLDYPKPAVLCVRTGGTLDIVRPDSENVMFSKGIPPEHHWDID